MRTIKKSTGFWAFLEQQGKVGSSGEELAALRKSYRKIYAAEYKRNYRARHKQSTLNFTPAEARSIKVAASEHEMKEADFIKKAVRGYLDNTYVVRHKEAVDRVLQMLLRYQAAIEGAEGKGAGSWFRPDRSYGDLARAVSDIQAQIKEVLVNPPKLADLVRQALIDKPHFGKELLAMLADHERD